jgi:sulfotransferase 6B1
MRKSSSVLRAQAPNHKQTGLRRIAKRRVASTRRIAAQSALLHSTRRTLIRSVASLTPAGSEPRVLVNSVPKAGTHLVNSVLDLLPEMRTAGVHLDQVNAGRYGKTSPDTAELDWHAVRSMLSRVKPGQYATSHLWSHPMLFAILDELDFRSIFIVRDPRDILVSEVEYICRLRRHHQHKRLLHDYTDRDARLRALIGGFPAGRWGHSQLPFVQRLRGYQPWLDPQDGVLCCRFEDLIGDAGGGSRSIQRSRVAEIGHHVKRPLDEAALDHIGLAAWSSHSPTFRKGTTGDWQAVLIGSTLEYFNEQVDAHVMAAFGYKQDG